LKQSLAVFGSARLRGKQGTRAVHKYLLTMN
jgi:hypothetical protein